MHPRSSTTAFLWMRLLAGATFAAAPGVAQRQWLGSGDGSSTGSVAARAMGARDVALSLGALAAARSSGDVRPWLLAAAVAEASDALAVLAVADQVPPSRRLRAVAGPGLLAAAAVALARR